MLNSLITGLDEKVFIRMNNLNFLSAEKIDFHIFEIAIIQ